MKCQWCGFFNSGGVHYCKNNTKPQTPSVSQQIRIVSLKSSMDFCINCRGEMTEKDVVDLAGLFEKYITDGEVIKP